MRLPLNTIFLASIDLLLLSLIATRLLQGTQVDAISATVRAPATVPALRFDLPAPRDLSSVQAQALFYRTRAFYVPPAVPVVELPPPDYRFVGSMSIPNQGATALLVHNQTGARIKVALGDTVESWSVAQVGPKSIVITNGARSLEITMASRGQAGGMTAVSGVPTRVTSSGMVRVTPPANQ